MFTQDPVSHLIKVTGSQLSAEVHKGRRTSRGDVGRRGHPGSVQRTWAQKRRASMRNGGDISTGERSARQIEYEVLLLWDVRSDWAGLGLRTKEIDQVSAVCSERCLLPGILTPRAFLWACLEGELEKGRIQVLSTIVDWGWWEAMLESEGGGEGLLFNIHCPHPLK